MENEKIDEKTILLFKQKNPEAIKKVYEKMSKKLTLTAIVILNSEEHAKGAVQETFIKALQAAHKLKEHVYFEAWLIKILKNYCIDMIRKESRKVSIEEVEESILIEYTDNTDNIQLMESLKKLKEEERLAVIYTYLWGMNSKEAGQCLNCGAGAVRMRVNRALKNLRAYMEV